MNEAVWSELTNDLAQDEIIRLHEIVEPEAALAEVKDPDIMGFCGKEGVSDEYDDAKG